MPIAAERLEVEVRADTSQASRELDSFYRDSAGKLRKANGQFASAADKAGLAGTKMGDDLGVASDKAGRKATSMGQKFRFAGGLVKAAAGGMVAAMGGSVINAASDLNENLSKTGVVFGPQAKIVTGAAQDMADKFGISKNEFLEAASGIGLVGKASGLTRREAANLGSDMGKLAADASSFYNVPVTEALDAMKSGLVGEAEPMRRFGVLLSENAVKSEAARLGIADMGSELTEGQKVQARSSLIMRGMSDASGDLERTQSSVSNRLRELRGRVVNFAADMGGKALPAAEAFLGAVIKAPRVIGGVVRAVGDWATNSATVKPVLDLVVSAVSGLVSGLGKVPGAFSAATSWVKGFVDQNAWLKPVLDSVAVAVAGFVAGFVAVLAVAKVIGVIKGIAVAIRVMSAAMMANPIGLIVGALVALGLVLYAAYKRFEPFRNVVNSVGAAIRNGLGVALTWLRGALASTVTWVVAKWAEFGPGIMRTLSAVGQGIAGFIRFAVPIFRAGFQMFVQVTKAVWGTIRGVIRGALNIIKGVVNVVMGVIRGDWSRVWKGIQQITSGVFGVIKSLVKGAIGVVRAVVVGGLNMIRAAWSGAWNAAKSLVASAFGNIKSAVSRGIDATVGFVKALPGRIKSGLGNLGSLLLQAGRDVVAGLGRGIRDAASNAIQAAKDMASDLAQAAREKLSIFSPSRVFAKIGRFVVEGLARGIRRNTKGATKAAVELAQKVIDGWSKAVADGPKTFQRFAGELRRWVRRAFGGRDEKTLLASIQSAGKRARAAMTREANVTRRLNAALARRNNQVEQRKSFIDSMSQGISSQANVLNAGNNATTIKESLQAQVAKVREFVKSIKAMRDAGFSNAVIAQVAGAGVEGGAEVAKALAAASAEDMSAINSAFGTITSLASKQSRQIGNSLYNSGIQAANGVVAGLKARRKAIAAELERIARAVQASITKAIGVKGGGGKKNDGKKGGGKKPGRMVVEALKPKGGGDGPPAPGGGGRPPAFTPASTGGGKSGGNLSLSFTTINPQAEKQSQTTNKALNRVAALGLV